MPSSERFLTLAVGGMLVGLVAPRLFTGYYELPLALIAGAALGAVALWKSVPIGAIASLVAMGVAGYYGYD